MFLVPNIDQMYKEMKKIVEVRNKHGNGDKFPDFADLFFFWGIIFFLGSVDRSETHIFFWPRPTRLVGFFIVLADRHVSPLGHIILIPSQPFFALLLLNVACLAEKQQIPIKVVGLTQSGSIPRSTALIPFEQV